MPKFYLIENAARPIDVNGKKFEFEAAEYFPPTNSFWGIFRADTPEDIEALDFAAARGSISEISAEDYAKMEIKKKNGRPSLSVVDLPTWQSPQMGAPKPEAAAPAVAAVKQAAFEAAEDILAARPAARSKK